MSGTGIALITDALGRGGAERLLVSLANHLDPQIYQIHVITTRRPGDLARELLPHVKFHCLNRSHRWDTLALFQLAEIIKEQNIKIVHTHCHSSAYLVEVVRALFRVNCFHVMHDHLGPVEATPWIRRLDRVFLTKLDLYIGVSEQLVQYASKYLGLPASKCRYFPNGIPVPSKIDRTPNKSFTIVQVGALVPDKNHLMSIRVAARVRDLIPDFKWILVGRIGENQKYLETLYNELRILNLENTVKLIGEKSDISKFLRHAHVGVLTSRHEGMPIALLEYMANGLPVIVTDVGACREVVEKCSGGIVCSVDDDEYFAETLIDLAGNPIVGMELGERNFRNISIYFSIKTLVENITKEYDNLLGFFRSVND